MTASQTTFLPLEYQSFVSRFNWSMELKGCPECILKEYETNSSRLIDSFKAKIADFAFIEGDYAKDDKRFSEITLIVCFDGTVTQGRQVWKIMETFIQAVGGDPDPGVVMAFLKLSRPKMSAPGDSETQLSVFGNNEYVSSGLRYRVERKEYGVVMIEVTPPHAISN